MAIGPNSDSDNGYLIGKVYLYNLIHFDIANIVKQNFTKIETVI